MTISNVIATAPSHSYAPTDMTTTARPRGAELSGGIASTWLTPGAVVAMLFAQLDATDGQIQDRVREMTGTLQEAESLSGDIADLKELAAQLASRKPGDQKLAPDDPVTMTGGEETTVAAVLERSGAGFLASNSEITLQALNAAIDSKTTELSRHNSGKEQSLIQMQSNLQSRQQIITMATQMLNAIHQPMSQIANNIGR